MQITYGWILTPRPFKERLLKVMKQAVSCKHRQAVKTIQCEKKLFNSHVNSSQVRKMCCETCGFNISQDGRQHGKPSCLLVVVKTTVKSAFLLWHHHGDTNTVFQLKLADFLVAQPEAVAERCSVKKVFLEISQSFATLIKRDSGTAVYLWILQNL